MNDIDTIAADVVQRLDTAALFRSDGKRLIEVLNQGLAGDEHAKFVRKLEAGRKRVLKALVAKRPNGPGDHDAT